MRRYSIYATLEGAQRAAADLSAVDGLPSRGRNVGRGVHVSAPKAWDGTGSAPPGWTARHAPRQAASGAWFVIIPLSTAAKRSDLAVVSRLDPNVRTRIESSIAQETSIRPRLIDGDLAAR